MQRQRLGAVACAKGAKLTAEPVAKQAEDVRRAALRRVIQLGEFRAKRSNRATEGHDLGPIGDQNMDE